MVIYSLYCNDDFLYVDGHHLLIKSLIESFNLLSLGRSIIFGETLMALIGIIVEYFIID